jgi:hypothetical protein
VAPSQSVVDLTRQLDPRWKDTAIEVVHHGLTPLQGVQKVAPRPRPDGKLRIVIPGSIHAGKGITVTGALRTNRVAQVYLLGAASTAVFTGGQVSRDPALPAR